MSLLVEVTNAAVALDVTVVKEGGVVGGAPTVAIRDGLTTNSYLDWSDHNFKTGSWTTKYSPLSEVERGHYQRLLDLTAIPGLTAGRTLIAEYAIADGGKTWVDHDVLLLIKTGENTDLLRKMITNRFEETPGNPGTITLFDDDSLTPLLSWQIRDAAGGGVVSNVGAPARRTKAT